MEMPMMERPTMMERPREVQFPSHELQHEPQLLGTIWIDCPYPLLSAGLKRALRSRTARLHQGPKPPEGRTPSAVICYAESDEDVASKVESVRALTRAAAILVFGSSPDIGLARATVRAGASGFVHASMPPEQLARAIEKARSGEKVLPRELLKELMAEMVAQERGPDLSGLSLRKLEILELVVEGLSNAQIAKRLYLSESTVKQHLRVAYKALGVKNRNQAASALGRNGSSGTTGRRSTRRA